VNSASDCPVGWNCHTVAAIGAAADAADFGVQACRNGLYCHPADARNPADTGVCEQCAGCTGANCGNCQTKFYPQVDQYSVLRLLDYCGDLAEEECAGHMGCMWADGAPAPATGVCRPGPTPVAGSSGNLIAARSAKPDKHVTFSAGQEFFLEMGQEGVGNGVVRSPVVAFANDDTASVIAMYAKIGLVDGHPRQIMWEQTGQINTACTPKVSRTGSMDNYRNVTVSCDSVGGHCPDLVQPWDGHQTGLGWDMTDCGFATIRGYYDENRKFGGMRWPVENSDPSSEQYSPNAERDCSQSMCAVTLDAAEGLSPFNIYTTWTGTDVDQRDMTSSGLSYESFRQYSAFEAISAARNVAREVAEKSRRCVTQKDC